MPSTRLYLILVADRCDRCGAQAFTRATVNGTELFFCGHHFRKHEAPIRLVAEHVLDERERINTTASL